MTERMNHYGRDESNTDFPDYEGVAEIYREPPQIPQIYKGCRRGRRTGRDSNGAYHYYAGRQGILHQPQGSAGRFGTAGAASGDDALGQLPLKAHCKVTWANLHDGNRFAQAAIYYSAVKS